MGIIIYHNADPDGIFGGAVCLKAFPNALTIGYNYEPNVKEIINQCEGKNVVMVDVSFKNWSDMHLLLDVCESLTWIDHHKTALADCEKHKTAELYEGKFTCVFEHEQYGACRKAYQHFFPNAVQIPLSIELVASYDVWRGYGSDEWNLRTAPFRHISGQLKTPQAVLELFSLEKYDHATVLSWLDKGVTIAQYIDYENELFVNNPSLCYESSFAATVEGERKIYKVLAVNKGLYGDMFKSKDLTDYDFTVGFYRQSDAWKVSLRGANKGVELGLIAKSYGGGGHQDAAGFSVGTFDELRKILFIQ